MTRLQFKVALIMPIFLNWSGNQVSKNYLTCWISSFTNNCSEALFDYNIRCITWNELIKHTIKLTFNKLNCIEKKFKFFLSIFWLYLNIIFNILDNVLYQLLYIRVKIKMKDCARKFKREGEKVHRENKKKKKTDF